MNIQKLVDSLDSNELKNLAKIVEKKLEKSEQQKQIERLVLAHNTNTPVELFGQQRWVVSSMRTFGLSHKAEFYLDNGSKIVFDLEGR